MQMGGLGQSSSQLAVAPSLCGDLKIVPCQKLHSNAVVSPVIDGNTQTSHLLLQ
jgi:hypothetical protein